MKNYLEQVKADIKQWLEDNSFKYNVDELKQKDFHEVWENYYEILWCEDSVTGNASGSYTCDKEQAKQFVLNDVGTVLEALKEFDVDAATIGNKFLEEDWEYLDVTARCYVVDEALTDVLGEELAR